MSAPVPRTLFAAPPLARLAGHARGMRLLNGKLAEYPEVEREFRERMMQLSGQLLLLENCRDGAEQRAMEQGVWDSIAGLHDVFGKDDMIDDLAGLLLLTREARMEGEITEVPAVLKRCVEEMAFLPHVEKTRLACSRRLRRAGVDLNRGL